MKLIGLAGAHRTGKTTLAQAFASKHKAHFFQMNTTELMAKHGFDSSDQSIPFENKLHAQQVLFNEYYTVFNDLRVSGHDLIITDRTPLDLASYLLIRVGPEESKQYSDEISKYLLNCIAMANVFYSGITVVQPGIPLISDDKSAVASMPYIEHLNALIIGLAHHDRNQNEIQIFSRLDTDIDTRLKLLAGYHNV